MAYVKYTSSTTPVFCRSAVLLFLIVPAVIVAEAVVVIF